MSTYLEIAEAVLSKSKLPLSARQILEAAYRLQLVPVHLFGKTQYKTLHARLSEDLTRNRRNTIFVRTAPGRFFLRAKVESRAGQPGEYIAPLRAYQLKQFDVVCASRDELNQLWSPATHSMNFREITSSLLRQVPFQQAERENDLLHVRILVILQSLDKVLTLTALAGANLGRGRSVGFLGYRVVRLRGTEK